MAVPFYRHSLPAHYAERVASVLASPFLTSGPRCHEVERTLRRFFGIESAKLPSDNRTVTKRPTFRRQCRGSSSGRLTPRDVISKVYAAAPVTSALSSAADAALLASAMSSSRGPVPCG